MPLECLNPEALEAGADNKKGRALVEGSKGVGWPFFPLARALASRVCFALRVRRKGFPLAGLPPGPRARHRRVGKDTPLWSWSSAPRLCGLAPEPVCPHHPVL